jgi:tryptophan-rich sensory protein
MFAAVPTRISWRADDRRRGSTVDYLWRATPTHGERRSEMLYTIAVVLIVLWLLGFVTSYTLGGFIHILLVIAVVMILVQVIQGRRL